MYYLNCFLVYSFLGYLLETTMSFITKSNFQSGIMYGPFTPIYGIGTVVILLLSKYFFLNLHMPRWIETIIVFFIVAIFLSCLELIGGLLIEKSFGVTFWDYTNHKFNIGKYISLEMALMWGIATIAFIYLINPLLEKVILKTPIFLTIAISTIMLIDFVFTIFKNIKR